MSLEGYIEKGIQLGLRPEFAIFRGQHETAPRAIDEPHLFKELYGSLSKAHTAPSMRLSSHFGCSLRNSWERSCYTTERMGNP